LLGAVGVDLVALLWVFDNALDAVRIEDAPSIVLERAKDAEVLLFDLP